jgi:hypothetical protein
MTIGVAVDVSAVFAIPVLDVLLTIPIEKHMIVHNRGRTAAKSR